MEVAISMYDYKWSKGVFEEAISKYGRVHLYCRKIVGCNDEMLIGKIQTNSPGWQEYKRILKAAVHVLQRVGWDALLSENYSTFVQQILHISKPHDENTLFGDLMPRSSVQYARRAQNIRGSSAASSIVPAKDAVHGHAEAN
jgi:hypothetical protein